MKRPLAMLFIALQATYILLAFILPTDPQVLAKLGLSEMEAKLLSLSIIIPVTLIYLAALYGFVRVREYAEKVRDSKEGPHFKNIGDGLMLLAFSLPVNSILGSIGSYIRHAQPHFLSDITIVRQYISLAFALTAILLISRGAKGLFDTLKQSNARIHTYYMLLGPIILACTYTWLIDTQSGGHGVEIYFLPDWLVILSIAVPYVFIWCTGIWAAILIHRYQYVVKGVIYKRAIDRLAKGIATIILTSVLLQFLTTLSGLLSRLDLSPLLACIYILIAIYAVGFGLVAQGAKKLKQLEEV
jgi:hypothetical protein